MKRSAGLVSCFAVGSLAVVGLMVSCSAASANDGGIAYGGSPRLLTGHPSVSMTSEVIRLSVEDEMVKVDCQFVFTNHGAACKVRMGFPDEGFGADDPDEEGGDDVMNTPPKTTFTSFHSFVNGKPIPTKLIRADKPGKYWHTKTVTFRAHAVVRVHDVYTQRIGGGIFSTGVHEGNVKQVGYIVHTGASWHGPIGRSEVDVTFHSKEISANPKLTALSRIAAGRNGHSGRDIKGNVPAFNTIVWKGPGAPTVKGKTLQFVRTNWTPKASDDIDLTYGYQAMKQNVGN